MTSPENLRAALIAASAVYPEGYGALKQLGTITATQHVQMVFDRAEEMAAWLDAKEQGKHATAQQVIAEAQEARRGARSTQPGIAADQWRPYARWLDEHNLRDSPSNQHRYLDTLPQG